MALIAAFFESKCKCGAVKIDGKWTKSPGSVVAAMKHELAEEKCGECSGSGPMFGGYPMNSIFGGMAAA